MVANEMVRSAGAKSFHRNAATSVADGWFENMAAAAAGWLLASLRVASERRTLKSLDERMLGDIGISRGDAEREAKRRFWDLPSHR